MAKMDTQTLKAILASERTQSLSSNQASKLTEERQQAMDFYLGRMEKVLPTTVGRSSAVSTDVADTVEGLMPPLMDIFCGGDEVVRFNPTRPDDEQAAEQESDYVNHHFLTHGGFLSLYSFIKDALLSKLGVVKVHWCDQTIEDRETYLDQDEQTYRFLISQPGIEVVEHSEHPDPNVPGYSQPGGAPGAPGGQPGAPPQLGPDGQPVPPPMLHDVTLVCKYERGYAKVEPVPPEEFGISRNARSIAEAGYCFHQVVRFEHELIDQGYDPEQLKTMPAYPVQGTNEERTRDTVEEGQFGGDNVNEANRRLLVTEHYIQLDYEGDGKPKLHRITTAGENLEILKRSGKEDVVEWDVVPFAAMTPVIMTHRVYGRSIADLVMDIQKIKTSLLRSLLDNAYLANNPRHEVSESHASENTLDDLLVSRPGGVVRTRQPGGIQVLMTPPIGGHVFPLLEYMDAIREQRTGVTKQGQGLDSQALQNQSATAVSQSFSASQARMKLIARIFAETGVKEIFKLLHHTLRKYGCKAETVKLRGKWTMVNPRDWADRNDMTIGVGLGNGGKTEQLQAHMVIVQAQTQALQAGLTNLVSMQNLYNSAKRLVAITGGKNPDEYFTDPSTQPPPQQKPDPKVMELQMKQQMEQDKVKADAEHQQMKTSAEIALAQKKFDLDSELLRQQAAQKAEEHKLGMATNVVKAATQVKTGPDGQQTGPDPQLLREMMQHFGQQQPRGVRIVRDEHGRVSHTEPLP